MSTQSYTSQQDHQHQQEKVSPTPTDNLSASFDDYRPEALAQAKLTETIQNGPKTIAQRKAHENMFGNSPKQLKEDPLQRLPGLEEEDMLQGKFNKTPAQLMEEEEMLQGKFDQKPAQLMEEEDMLQGKFDQKPTQLMEEEDMLQGKFDQKPTQLMEEEDMLQGKFDQKPAQLMEEEEMLQGKFDQKPTQLMEEEDMLQGKFDNNSPTIQKAENGLPTDLNSKLESTVGTDLSDVNIHANSNHATEMGALAYAQGTDVHFAPGQFKPETSAGQKLIGHEIAHVAQQAEGRVKPTLEVNGMPVNDNKGLEQEADRVGDKVARG